jgi:hypothetical protein
VRKLRHSDSKVKTTMIDAFKRTSKRIFADIRSLRNIDAYVVALFAVVFAVFTAFGDSIPDQYKMAALLAGVALLVFNITTPEQKPSATLDDYLNDRSSFPPLKERIKTAHKLWIYGPSAVNILGAENSLAIKNSILNQKDGELRIIIQNPNEKAAMDILIRQLDELIDYKVQDLPHAIQETLDRLRHMRQWKTMGTFEYRLLDYCPGFSMVAIDPDKNNGVVIVEFYGFYHEHTANRMNIEITKALSERWYTYWVSQFDHMWKHAKSPEEVER